jgi:hypothetical protein
MRLPHYDASGRLLPAVALPAASIRFGPGGVVYSPLGTIGVREDGRMEMKPQVGVFLCTKGRGECMVTI